MRINHLTLTNFKGFASCEFGLDPRFNLFVGDNATGKTSVLDAVSIALDSWFLGMKGVEKAGGIDSDEVRVVPHGHGDSTTFEKQFPARIEAQGTVLAQEVAWARELNREGGRTTTAEAKEPLPLGLPRRPTSAQRGIVDSSSHLQLRNRAFVV